MPVTWEPCSQCGRGGTQTYAVAELIAALESLASRCGDGTPVVIADADTQMLLPIQVVQWYPPGPGSQVPLAGAGTEAGVARIEIGGDYHGQREG